jgi:hypothetical protein
MATNELRIIVTLKKRAYWKRLLRFPKSYHSTFRLMDDSIPFLKRIYVAWLMASLVIELG